MPMLPSGRRVEFSLDRFHSLLLQMPRAQARAVAGALDDPDDLLPVLDAVHFSRDDGAPYFADYVASDWATGAAEWSTADRRALRDWLASDAARARRAQAIAYVRELVLGPECAPLGYPYMTVAWPQPSAQAIDGSTLRQ